MAMASLGRGFTRWYTQQTATRPWATAIVTGTTIVSASDLTAQVSARHYPQLATAHTTIESPTATPANFERRHAHQNHRPEPHSPHVPCVPHALPMGFLRCTNASVVPTVQSLEGNGQIDYRRLSALAAYGGLYAGAGHKVLYAFLERVVPQQWSLTGRTLSQMALSQLVHTPLIQLPVFYGLTGWARGYERQQIERNLRDTYETTLMRNYVFW